MINPFITQKEFIELDNRSKRPKVITTPKGTYYANNINQEFLFNKHRISLPITEIQNKTILDVGSCLGATGSWVLANGANSYCGLEIQKNYASLSQTILSKYYTQSKFEIINQGLDDFKSDQKYDIVICSGVLYGLFDPFAAIQKLAALAKETIIIESLHPYHGYRSLFKEATDDQLQVLSKELCLIENRRRSHMVDARAERSLMIVGSLPSLNSLIMMFEDLNWQYDSELHKQAEQQMPEDYNLLRTSRFMAKFIYNKNCNQLKYFKEEINKEVPESIVWRGNSIKK